MSYPRTIDGAVRKPDDRRKRARDAKKARKDAEEAARREEVKRLKNLKRAEIEDRWGGGRGAGIRVARGGVSAACAGLGN